MYRSYVYFCIVMGVISLFLMRSDKKRAEKHKQRIPEATFMLLSALGGFGGIYLGMFLFRHKTHKYQFQVKILLGTIAHLAFCNVVLPHII